MEKVTLFKGNGSGVGWVALGKHGPRCRGVGSVAETSPSVETSHSCGLAQFLSHTFLETQTPECHHWNKTIEVFGWNSGGGPAQSLRNF